MAIVCIVRPARTHERHFNARAVARVYCKAVSQGVSRAEIEREVAACIEKGQKPQSEAAQALAVAEAALLESNIVLDSQQSMLERMLAFLGIAAALGRFVARIGGARVKAVAIGAVAIKELAENRLKAIIAQKAANDAAIAIIRRAAANEAQFLRVIGR